MRATDDIIRRVRDILLNLDELKGRQNVGTNQIVAKPYATANAYDGQYAITAPFQSAGSSFKSLRINVIPQGLTANNILISDLVLDVRHTNGVRVSKWDFNNNILNYNTYYFVEKANPADASQNTYFVGIVAPTNTVLRVKPYIVANSDLTFTITELN